MAVPLSSAGEIDNSIERQSGQPWYIETPNAGGSDPLQINIITDDDYTLTIIEGNSLQNVNGILVIPINAVLNHGNPSQPPTVSIPNPLTVNSINVVVYNNYDTTHKPKVDPLGTHIVHTGPDKMGFRKQKKFLIKQFDKNGHPRKPIKGSKGKTIKN